MICCPSCCPRPFLSADLMTEMMDLSSDVGGPGLPLLDYRTYAERVFFPGQQVAPLSRQLDLPDSRRQTVEQGLQQLNNLLNNRLFLTRVCRRRGGGWKGHVTPHLDTRVTTVSVCASLAVHPHTGGPAGLLPAGPRLRGQPAHHGAARQAGVLHRGHEEPAAGPGAAVRRQEPQAYATPVRDARNKLQKVFLSASIAPIIARTITAKSGS